MHFISTVAAEMIKVRRSSVWVVVAILPSLAVFSGSINYSLNAGQLSRGWDSYWSQVVLFHGLLFCSVAIAILASSMWRMEHAGNNWIRLVDTPSSQVTLLAAKAVVLLGLVTAMQAVLLALALGVGSMMLQVPGPLPTHLVVVSLVSVLAASGVVGLQLLLSMVIRSFAAPVLLGLLGALIGVAVTLSGNQLGAWLVPQALVLRSVSLGSTAIAGAETVGVSAAAGLIAPALGLGAGFVLLAAVILSHRDVR